MAVCPCNPNTQEPEAEAGEKDQQLRVLVTFPESPDLVSRTHMMAHNHL